MHQDPELEQEVGQRFSLPLLKEKTVILVESHKGTLYEITMVRPLERLVTLYSTDSRLKKSAPKLGVFVHSIPEKSGHPVSDWFVKGMKLVFRLDGGGLFTTETVASALVQGDGWSYEAITNKDTNAI